MKATTLAAILKIANIMHYNTMYFSSIVYSIRGLAINYSEEMLRNEGNYKSFEDTIQELSELPYYRLASYESLPF